MNDFLKLIKFCFLFLIIFSCNSKDQYEEAQKKLAPFYALKVPPQSDDWLYTRTEKYQSLNDYIQSKPTSIDSVRKKIYIALIGDFDSAQKDIVYNTAEYLKAFYELDVEFMKLKRWNKFTSEFAE